MVFTHKLCSGFGIHPPCLDLLQQSELVVHLGHLETTHSRVRSVNLICKAEDSSGFGAPFGRESYAETVAIEFL